MSNSYFLQLPYIMPAQAQKHVTHNEAVRLLDALLHLTVLEQTLATPPSEPQEGDRYIIASNATGQWAGKETQVTAFLDGAWMFFEPKDGWLVWDQSSQTHVIFQDGEWSVSGLGSGSGDGAELSELNFVGINASASETERLVVESESVLLSHDGDDHRLKINKAAETNTASLLFQTGYSGRAEFGLAGEDKFSVKVSPDGLNWLQSMVVSPQDGHVEFPSSGVGLDPSMFSNLLPDSGRFNASDEQDQLTASSSEAPGYITPFNNAAVTYPFRFIHNNSTFGGTQDALDPIVSELITKIFGASGLRFGPEFWCMEVQSGTGTSSVITIDGEQFRRATMVRSSPRPNRYTTGFFVKCESGKLALRPPLGTVRKVLRDGVEVAYGTQGVVVLPSDGWVYFEIQITKPSVSYDQSDMAINLGPSSVAYFALPRVIAGWVSIGANQAVVTNDRVFGN